jgi:hypothetical protein
MRAMVRALDDAGLLTTDRNQTADAVWLVLALSTGLPAALAVPEARRIARLVNVAQYVNLMPLGNSDPDITVFGGLSDFINIRRSTALLADFTLAGWRGNYVATLTVVVTPSAANPVFGLPPGKPFAWSFECRDDPPETVEPVTLRRTALLSHLAIEELAEVLGPAPAEVRLAIDEMDCIARTRAGGTPELATMTVH